MKKVKDIDAQIESGLRRIFAIIAGIIFCVILTVILAIYTALEWPDFSLSSIGLFFLPSLIIGTLLGWYFPKTFGFLASIVGCVGIDL